MKNNYLNYSDNDIIQACKTSMSYAEALKKLGLVSAGGNYKQLQKNIDRLSIDISHMKHQASNQGKKFKPFEELTKTSSIKSRLINEHGPHCWACGLHTWMDNLIPLELDHINGNNRDNSRDNLRLLCPNCHALTPTWRRRNK